MAIIQRMKRRKKSGGFLQRLGDFFVLGLGAFAFYTAATGLATGEISVFSRLSDGAVVAQSTQPLFFWGTVAAWLFGGCFIVYLVVSAWRE